MPLTERQQMAFLLEMTAKEFKEETDKKNESKKLDEEADSKKASSSSKSELSKINKRNKRGETQLHLAAIKGDIDAVKSLIKKGADVNVTDYAGWAPLHEGCSRGHYKIVKILLKAGADANAKGLEDDTPLHDASSNDHVKIVHILLKYGADPMKRNDDLETPLDLAASSEISKVLEQYCSLTDLEKESYGINADFLSDSSEDDDFGEKDEQKTADQISDSESKPGSWLSNEFDPNSIEKNIDISDEKKDPNSLSYIVPDENIVADESVEDDEEINFTPRKKKRRSNSLSKRITSDDDEESMGFIQNKVSKENNVTEASDKVASHHGIDNISPSFGSQESILLKEAASRREQEDQDSECSDSRRKQRKVVKPSKEEKEICSEIDRKKGKSRRGKDLDEANISDFNEDAKTDLFKNKGVPKIRRDVDGKKSKQIGEQRCRVIIGDDNNDDLPRKRKKRKKLLNYALFQEDENKANNDVEGKKVEGSGHGENDDTEKGGIFNVIKASKEKKASGKVDLFTVEGLRKKQDKKRDHGKDRKTFSDSESDRLGTVAAIGSSRRENRAGKDRFLKKRDKTIKMLPSERHSDCEREKQSYKPRTSTFPAKSREKSEDKRKRSETGDEDAYKSRKKPKTEKYSSLKYSWQTGGDLDSKNGLSRDEENADSSTASDSREVLVTSSDSESPDDNIRLIDLVNSKSLTENIEKNKHQNVEIKVKRSPVSEECTSQLTSAFNDNPYISDISDAENVEEDDNQKERMTSDMFRVNIFNQALNQTSDNSPTADSSLFTGQQSDSSLSDYDSRVTSNPGGSIAGVSMKTDNQSVKQELKDSGSDDDKSPCERPHQETNLKDGISSESQSRNINEVDKTSASDKIRPIESIVVLDEIKPPLEDSDMKYDNSLFPSQNAATIENAENINEKCYNITKTEIEKHDSSENDDAIDRSKSPISVPAMQSVSPFEPESCISKACFETDADSFTPVSSCESDENVLDVESCVAPMPASSDNEDKVFSSSPLQGDRQRTISAGTNEDSDIQTSGNSFVATVPLVEEDFSHGSQIPAASVEEDDLSRGSKIHAASFEKEDLSCDSNFPAASFDKEDLSHGSKIPTASFDKEDLSHGSKIPTASFDKEDLSRDSEIPAASLEKYDLSKIRNKDSKIPTTSFDKEDLSRDPEIPAASLEKEDLSCDSKIHAATFDKEDLSHGSKIPTTSFDKEDLSRDSKIPAASLEKEDPEPRLPAPSRTPETLIAEESFNCDPSTISKSHNVPLVKDDLSCGYGIVSETAATLLANEDFSTVTTENVTTETSKTTLAKDGLPFHQESPSVSNCFKTAPTTEEVCCDKTLALTDLLSEQIPTLKQEEISDSASVLEKPLEEVNKTLIGLSESRCDDDKMNNSSAEEITQAHFDASKNLFEIENEKTNEVSQLKPTSKIAANLVQNLPEIHEKTLESPAISNNKPDVLSSTESVHTNALFDQKTQSSDNKECQSSLEHFNQVNDEGDALQTQPVEDSAVQTQPDTSKILPPELDLEVINDAAVPVDNPSKGFDAGSCDTAADLYDDLKLANDATSMDSPKRCKETDMKLDSMTPGIDFDKTDDKNVNNAIKMKDSTEIGTRIAVPNADMALDILQPSSELAAEKQLEKDFQVATETEENISLSKNKQPAVQQPSDVQESLSSSRFIHEEKLIDKDVGCIEHLGPFHGTKFEESDVELQELSHPEDALKRLLTEGVHARSPGQHVALQSSKNEEAELTVLSGDVNENFDHLKRTYFTELSEEDKHIVNMSMEIAENLNSNACAHLDDVVNEAKNENTSVLNEKPGNVEENASEKKVEQICEFKHSEKMTIDSEVKTHSVDIEKPRNDPLLFENADAIATELTDESKEIQPRKTLLKPDALGQGASETTQKDLHCEKNLSFSGPYNSNSSRSPTSKTTRTVDIEPRGIPRVVADIDLHPIAPCQPVSFEQPKHSDGTVSPINNDNIETDATGKTNEKTIPNSESAVNNNDESMQNEIPEKKKTDRPTRTSSPSYPSTWREKLFRNHVVLHPKIPAFYHSFSLFTGKYHLEDGEETSSKDDDVVEEVEEMKEEHAVELEKLHLCMEQELVRIESKVQLVSSNNNPISACSTVMHQKLEQYAKLGLNPRCNSQPNADIPDAVDLRKSWIQEVLDKYIKLEQKIISRQKKELGCLEQQVSFNKLHAIGRKEVLRRKYLNGR